MIPASWETNLTVSARLGTTLTADVTPHTEAASYTELITSTVALAEAFAVRVQGVSGGGTDTGVLVDIATGAAAAEVAILNDYDAGQAAGNVTGAAVYGVAQTFPRRIAASTRLSGRIRATVVSETAVVALAVLEGAGHIENVGSWVTYGAVTASSRGTLVAPGNGAYGSWTEIGTTSEAHNLLRVGYDAGGDTTILGGGVLVRLGFGGTAGPHANDAALVAAGGTVIAAPYGFVQGNAEEVTGPFPDTPVYAVVGNGARLWACIAEGATENRGIIIYGATGTVITAGAAGVGPGRGIPRGLAH